MSDPFGLISIAAARGGGSVDGYGASQLVAAGQTLLQRSAPLVRALMGKRSAILLPPSHQFFTALAASDGRGAVLINPLAAPAEVAFQLTDAEVGATFTSRALAAKLPPDAPRVYLDDSPRTAVAEVAGDIRTIDLGSHVGLAIEGDPDVPGSDDEAVVVYTSAMAGLPLGAVLTHRNLLANLRSSLKATDASPADHALAVIPFAHLFGLVVSGLTPLLSGAKLTCMERFHPVRAINAIEELGISVIVGVPAIFASLTIVLERRGEGLRNNRLRVCICGGAPLEPTLQERWF
ncbi:MAG: AMP-binding protein, partial [Gemmatimonadaceae bacterium]